MAEKPDGGPGKPGAPVSPGCRRSRGQRYVVKEVKIVYEAGTAALDFFTKRNLVYVDFSGELRRVRIDNR